MKYIFLIGNENFNIDLLKKVKYPKDNVGYDVDGISERYCVKLGNEHIFYDVITDFSDFIEDIMLVPYNKLSIVMMTYTSSRVAKDILRLEDFPKEIYIDNDFGIIVPLGKFIDMGMPDVWKA